MAFLNASLIAMGGLLIAVPIGLHLLMRQEPRRIVFPALQFVKRREATNRTRLRLRQWLLLALRCTLVLLFAALLARPTVDSARLGNWLVASGVGLVALFVVGLLVMARMQGKGRSWIVSLLVAEVVLAVTLAALVVHALANTGKTLLGDQRAPVAVTFVVDVAPRMMYQDQSRSRLEQARESGLSLLWQLPEGSDIAVLDTGSRDATFLADRSAAARALKGLEIANRTRTLPEVVREARSLLSESDRPRKEIYVFTDLSRQAWLGARPTESILGPGSHENVAVYVLDIGARSSRNLSLGVPRIAAQTMSIGSELYLDTEIINQGPSQTTTVELFLETPSADLPVIIDGRPALPRVSPRRRLEVKVVNNGQTPVSFAVGGLERGVYHGFIQLRASDGLPFDDRRYFTVSVEPSWPILIVAGDHANARYVRDALAPVANGDNPYQIDESSIQDLAMLNLVDYSALCLLNPPTLNDSQWARIADFVRQGRGMIVCLGDNSSKNDFNNSSARQILPIRLGNQWRAPEGDVFIAPTIYDHPVLQSFPSDRGSIPWDALPVWQHWGIDELDSDATVICRYSNGQPAIVEKLVGQGRVMLLTTSISDPPHDRGRPAWNRLLTDALESWPGFVLCNELVRYAAGGEEQDLNFQVGQPAELLTNSVDGARWQLFTPSSAWRDVRAQGGYLSFPFTDEPGNYRLGAIDSDQPVRGFSVNIPLAASDLERLPEEGLARSFGDVDYQLASSQDEIQREARTGRVGQEFYPYLAVLLATVLVLEYVLSNCFHGAPLARGSVIRGQPVGAG